MKRAAELVPLSRQHHQALVLARRASEPSRVPAGDAPVHVQVLRRWAQHFEPHFALEEQVLFPALEAAGEGARAAEGARQHRHLRELVDRLRAGDLACLAAWGEAMRRHVQWEERELFPVTERRVDLAALAARLAIQEE